ncbi:MAG TPA: hypothetical protein VLL54_07565 [Pyrinomonadaceae bacterium]|nr:hypothetical protein [Pyrinomonadaceae bacterium]
MKWVGIFLLLLLVSVVHGQEFRPGVINPHVAVASDASQSYALYLPKDYSPKKRWPIIYAFDPLGRGQVPVERFSEAAERFGYIVVGSNNSRNGLPGMAIGNSIEALWKDSHARLAIDEKRIYAAGFSGGARVANRLASSCGDCIAGVISCGAGFPPEVTPSNKLTYAFFGTIGIDDFNFREMRTLSRLLDSLGWANQTETFAGLHQWLPKELAVDALEWMDLQAMKSGRRERDQKFIEDFFTAQLDRVQKLSLPVELVDRYLALGDLVVNFKPVRDVAAPEAELRALESSKELKSALADEKRQMEKEQTLAQQIVGLRNGLLSSETHNDALKEIRDQLATLQRQSQETVDSSNRRVARRALGQIFAETLETALFIHEPQKKFDLAIANLELAAQVYPAQTWAEYELARAFAMDGRKDLALDTLERVVKKGFGNRAALESEVVFASLRSGERFKRILDSMK